MVNSYVYSIFFYSVKDTVVALEALAEYEIKKPRPKGNIKAEFTVPGKAEVVTLELKNMKEKVETELKVFQMFAYKTPT